MSKIVFNNLVKKMLRKRGKLFLKDDIFLMIDPEKKDKNKSKLNYIIARLKAQRVIISIKAGVYIVPTNEDLELAEIDLLEKYFIKLLKKIISYECGSSYYIAGDFSLQLHLKNFSLPDTIQIITRNTQKIVKVGDFTIQFKTITGNYEGKKKNLFGKFFDMKTKIQISEEMFNVAPRELALLDAALVHNTNEPINITLITKLLKRYKNDFETDIFYEACKYKYIMSANRLKELSRNISPELYNIFLDIIKKNGNLFIGEGLRGI